MTVPSLLMVSVLQRRGVEHKVLVARDLCSRLSSLTLRGTPDGGEWVSTMATAEFGYVEASWISFGEGTVAAPFPVSCLVFSGAMVMIFLNKCGFPLPCSELSAQLPKQS